MDKRNKCYWNYNNLTVAVSIQSPERERIIMSKDIHSAEDGYIAKTEEAQLAQDKECYDRASAVCKWAGTCGATLKSQRVQYDNYTYLLVLHQPNN